MGRFYRSSEYTFGGFDVALPKFSLTFNKKAIFFMELICTLTEKVFEFTMTEEIFVDLFQTKSFDDIWYWLLLAVAWSLTTHWTMGVGNHDAREAQEKGGKYMSNFETLVGIYCQRIEASIVKYGSSVILVCTFLLASLATLGFWFWILFAQAMFILVFPLCLTTLVSIVFASRQVRDPAEGKELLKRYRKLRLLKQAIGVFAISTASFWGAIVTFQQPAV